MSEDRRAYNNVASSWEQKSDTRFVYDGWNLLAEIGMLSTSDDAPANSNRPYVRRSYIGGHDISGSWQGAGGLLAVRRQARGTRSMESYWTSWDLNGNITGLCEAGKNPNANPIFVALDGKWATYDYDAFGHEMRVSEPEADLNPFRFSTKYQDVETGLYYYGYRYYNSTQGRWLNRDPIGERGGLNLYGMVENDPVNKWDYLGLDYHHWFPQQGRTKYFQGFRWGEVEVFLKFPDICPFNIDDYTTKIPGQDPVTRSWSGSAHQWLHSTKEYGEIYNRVFTEAKNSCEFLLGMYSLMQITHQLLRVESQYGGSFPKGSYNEQTLKLRNYYNSNMDTMPKYLKKIEEVCFRSRRRSKPSFVQELERKLQDFQWQLLMHKNLLIPSPFPTFHGTGRIQGDVIPRGKGPNMVDFNNIIDGGMFVAQGALLGVAILTPMPADDVVALPTAAMIIRTGWSALKLAY